MTDLLLHCGANKVEASALTRVDTPAPTETHFPIPHDALIEHVQGALLGAGYGIKQTVHALTGDGARYFGMMELFNGTAHPDYATIVGLRNSHDKRFPAGLVVGSSVFVCDNLAFSGEIKVARKHTKNIMRDLELLVSKAVGKLGAARATMDKRIRTYKGTVLLERDAWWAVRTLAKAQVFGKSKVMDVYDEFMEPSHNEFKEGGLTSWRLFNAVTEIIKGRFPAPDKTQALHGIMDGVCARRGTLIEGECWAG